MFNTNFYRRTLSTLVALPVIIGALYWSAWSYFLLFLGILLPTLLEFYKLVSKVEPLVFKVWGIFSGILLYTLTFIYVQNWIAPAYLWLLMPCLLATYLLAIYTQPMTSPLTSIAYTFLGIIYVSMPFSILHFLVFIKGIYHKELILGIVFILWASDIGAYVIGSLVGKKPLFKRISPKKTWEGSIGGALLALLISYIIAQYDTTWDLWEWLGTALIIVIAGTYGDLLESLLKRSLHIKDSGSIIPGHGGFLDRFDGFLLAIPLIVACSKVGYGKQFFKSRHKNVTLVASTTIHIVPPKMPI